jgi:predicted metalloprotease with PDZ domain
LIQASREFFSSKDSEDLTYSKGFVVAFLMDLELFFHGDTLKSLDDFFKQLFRKYTEGKEPCSGPRIMRDIDTVGLLKKLSDKWIKRAEDQTGKISLLEYGLEFMDGQQKFALSRQSPRAIKKKIQAFLSFAYRR